MTEYRITVAFEITKPKHRALSGAFFNLKTVPPIGSSSNTVSRLLGRRLESSTAFRNQYQQQSPEKIHDLLIFVSVTNVRATNSILTLTFDIPAEKIEIAHDLRLVNSRTIKSIGSKIGVELESGHYIYGVATSTSTLDLGLQRNVRDCWMHDQTSAPNLYIAHQVYQELATRIAIERALIAKALDDPSNPVGRWVRTPMAARLVRALPVELLIDRQDTQASYLEMREAMNLPKLREETLDRARTWHVAFGTVLAFTAAAAALLTILLR